MVVAQADTLPVGIIANLAQARSLRLKNKAAAQVATLQAETTVLLALMQS